MSNEIQVSIEAKVQSSQTNAASVFAGLLRVRQWTKNGLIFAGLIFSGQALDAFSIYQASLGFMSFCLLSSFLYIVNDIRDVEEDRSHPTKRMRPIASGRISIGSARVVAAIALLAAISIAAILPKAFWLVGGLYLANTMLYTYYIKHVVIVDVMSIAVGFVLRAVAGAVVIDVLVSPWLLLCTGLLALFLGFGKRRNELIVMDGRASEHRKVLNKYSQAFLDQLINVVTSATVMSYSLYTFGAHKAPFMMLTIPFVIYGVFRYLFLIYQVGEGGAPDRLLLSDRPLQVNLVLWLLIAVVVVLFTKTGVGA